MGMYASLFAIPEPLLDQMRVDAAVRNQWLGDLDAIDTHGLGELWHGVHYMLCGSAKEKRTPLGRAIIGGAPLPGPDLGHGPPLSLRAHEVAEAAAAMAELEPTVFAARFDPAAMAAAEVYPSAMWEREADTVIDELISAYVGLRDYFQRAAEADLAMLSWIC